MRLALFCHSLASDWNHGNAHFLRGVTSELLARGHAVRVFEPEDGWSRRNACQEYGRAAVEGYRQLYPELDSTLYRLDQLDLDQALDGMDAVLVHEWSNPELVRRIGDHRAAGGSYRLLFHDTHHRSATAPQEMDRYRLEHYDGVLAFGNVIRDLYLQRGWAEHAWTWHEAADATRFKPLEARREGDLVWIGNWGDGERSEELAEFLLEPIRQLQLKAAVYGVRYPENGLQALRKAGADYRGWLPNHRVPETFARFGLTLHIPRRPYRQQLPGIPTIRVFEALACGIPLICAPWEDAESLFRPGDYLVAHDGREMTRLIRQVLLEPDLAAELARRGRETISERHTCAHRVDELLEILGGLQADTAPGERLDRAIGEPVDTAPGERTAELLPNLRFKSRTLPRQKATRKSGSRGRFHIAFFGSSLVSAYWNGAATYYRGLLRALADRGHRITFYEPDAFGRQQHRDIPDPDWARVVVYSGTDPAAASRAVDQARGADFVVKASGVGVFDQQLEHEVAQLGDSGAATIFWDVDAPATLQRLHEDPGDPFHCVLGRYDFILTYGGGPPVVAAYQALGARLCVPIYNALDPTTHHPVDPDPQFAADLSFLGNRLPDREERVHEFFFRSAAALPERSFLLGGSGWEQHVPQLPNVRYAGHVYTHQHNAFNCTPLAVLNISRESMARTGYSPATRVFEAAGAGACLITDAWEGLDGFLEPEREVLVATGGEDLVRHLRDLSPRRAAALGHAARRRILAEHTYAHRARQVEALLNAETVLATP